MRITGSILYALLAVAAALPARATEVQFAWSVREMMNTLAKPGVDPAFNRSGYFAFFAQPDLADVSSLSAVSPRPDGTDRWAASTEKLHNVSGTWAAFYDDKSPTLPLVALVSSNDYFVNANYGFGLLIPGSSSNCVGCFGKKSQLVSDLLPDTAKFVITVQSDSLKTGQTVNWHWRASSVQLSGSCDPRITFNTVQFDMPGTAGGAETPEPGTLGLLAGGAGILAYVRFRRRRQSL